MKIDIPRKRRVCSHASYAVAILYMFWQYSTGNIANCDPFRNHVYIAWTGRWRTIRSFVKYNYMYSEVSGWGVFFFFFLHHITPPQPTCIYYCTLCTYRATPTERVYGLGGNGKTCRIPNVKLKSKIVKKKINNKQIRIISYVRQKW